MHKEEIKAAIRKRGVSVAALSQERGCASNAVSVALKKPWPAVQDRPAYFLKLPPRCIWPERYLADGTTVTARQQRKDSTAGAARNNQSALQPLSTRKLPAGLPFSLGLSRAVWQGLGPYRA